MSTFVDGWNEPGADELAHDTIPAPSPTLSLGTTDEERQQRARDPSLRVGLYSFSVPELESLADQVGDMIDVCEVARDGREPSPFHRWLRVTESRVRAILATRRSGR